jgi:hypothetical protein
MINAEQTIEDSSNLSENWKPMETAHRDGRYILALYTNNLFLEPVVVYYNGDDGIYPWSSYGTAFPESRLVAWDEMPKMYANDNF